MPDLLDEVRALAEQLGRAPTVKELRLAGVWHTGKAGYARPRDLLLAAGVTPRAPDQGRAHTQARREEVRQAVLAGAVALAAELGRTPTHRELQKAKIWNPGRAGFENAAALLMEAGLPLRPANVRLGSQRDQTGVRMVPGDKRGSYDLLPPWTELDAQGQRRSLFRLKAHNELHPHRRPNDADLPFERWMA